MATTPSRLVLSLLLAAVSSASALAQQPPSSPQAAPDASTLTFKVTSPLTIENVTVTDAAGKPVHGLKQSDFTVKEDGKPQEIKNFEEYGAEIPSKQSAPPTLPPNVYTNAQPPASTTRAVNILLLDTLNAGPVRQGHVMEKAISYLKSMPPDTEIGIFELGSELRMVQGFTADRTLLLAAMDSFTPKTSSFQPHRIDSAPPPPGTQPSKAYLAEVEALIESESEILNARSRTTTAALDAIAAFASGIKGRKNLIWFTTGLPQVTSYELLKPMLSLLVDFRPELTRAYGLLTAAQVAVYPVNPRGLDAGGVTAAEEIGELPIEETDSFNRLSRFSMEDIAENTGGVAYYNRNDLDAALGEAIATGADYYSLSYVPPPSEYDGKYHKIEVKVDRPGLHLQYREGYTDIDLTKAPAEEKAAKNPVPPDSEFHTAIDHGVVPSTQLLFEVRVTPSPTPATPGDPPAGLLNPKLNGKRLVRYQFLYAVPTSEITLAPESNGTRKGSVEFDTVAYGEDGVKVNVARETVNLTVKPDQLAQFMQRPLYVPVQLDLPPGKIDIHAGVLDGPSQKMGTLEFTETVTGK